MHGRPASIRSWWAQNLVSSAAFAKAQAVRLILLYLLGCCDELGSMKELDDGGREEEVSRTSLIRISYDTAQEVAQDEATPDAFLLAPW